MGLAVCMLPVTKEWLEHILIPTVPRVQVLVLLGAQTPQLCVESRGKFTGKSFPHLHSVLLRKSLLSPKGPREQHCDMSKMK